MKPTDPQPAPKYSAGPDIAALVQDDICERYKRGIKEYGVPLRPFNGRKPLLDAYQEAIDQVMYLRQEIYERDHPEDGPTAGTRSPVIAAIVKLVADHSRRLLALEAKAEQPQPPVCANTQLLFLKLLLCWLSGQQQPPVPAPTIRVRAEFSDSFSTVRGELPMAFRIATNQSITLHLTAADKTGRPAPVENCVWSVADPATATIEAAADGLSAKVSALGTPGRVSGEVRADSRIGDGENILVGTFEVEIVPREASQLTITGDDPVDIEAAGDPADAPIPNPNAPL